MNEQFFNLIISYKDYWGKYHDHKEKMAWLAVPLYFTGFYFLINKSELSFNSFVDRIILLLLISLYFVYLIWQFRNREIAYKYVVACTNILTSCFNNTYEIDYNPVTCNGFSWPTTFIDELLNVEINTSIWNDRISELFIYLGSLIWTYFNLYRTMNNYLVNYVFISIPLFIVIWRLFVDRVFKKCVI